MGTRVRILVTVIAVVTLGAPAAWAKRSVKSNSDGVIATIEVAPDGVAPAKAKLTKIDWDAKGGKTTYGKKIVAWTNNEDGSVTIEGIKAMGADEMVAALQKLDAFPTLEECDLLLELAASGNLKFDKRSPEQSKSLFIAVFSKIRTLLSAPPKP